MSETLAQLSDSLKAKENEASEYKNAAQHNAKGFSALALSLDFVANKIGGLDAPKLRRQIEQLQKQLDKKEEDLAVWRAKSERLEVDIKGRQVDDESKAADFDRRVELL